MQKKKKKKNGQKVFRFRDNCLWKYIHKLPLLRTEYLLSAVNGLTNSRKILHVTQRHISNLNCFDRDQ